MRGDEFAARNSAAGTRGWRSNYRPARWVAYRVDLAGRERNRRGTLCRSENTLELGSARFALQIQKARKRHRSQDTQQYDHDDQFDQREASRSRDVPDWFHESPFLLMVA